MSRAYKVTGINLKGMPIGETDRLLTVLTIERGLIRVVAPGARKHKSRLGGRSGQFVINELLIIPGRQLDKLVQAETVQSFPGLAVDLGKLTASQYLAEIVLCQALSEQPQTELFALFKEHLARLEETTGDGVLACLSQGVFHLLALAGVAPEVRRCCLSQVPVVPDLVTANWQAGFSPLVGGVVSFEMVEKIPTSDHRRHHTRGRYADSGEWQLFTPAHRTPGTAARSRPENAVSLITAPELALLQRLGQHQLLTGAPVAGEAMESIATRRLWQRIERLLRQYTQYQLERPIRSAALIDTCFPVAAASES